ncbi:phosphoribulokinase/uridine kinase [Peptoclostridium acidaminophilum DSM 3953]|uniref:Phosphoribulokinase/uridine kinase n=1 Tax=Peptoclostridium acidaminophilum DSM 3953 TaxID=1286171 RepID=W8TEC7_PEPAC|nr:nucleoside kinase [Peptoclostridium acidaminophilum]AHM56158.1 phosphoribulokinase/uridine kinase [Peptoclostridium acidaminophilum DSM 3953]
MAQIKVEILLEEKEYTSGATLLEVLENSEVPIKKPVLLAVVDNELKELTDCLEKSCKIKFLGLEDTDGMRTYMRSMSFIFIMACRDIIPSFKVSIDHTIGKGLYCRIAGSDHVSPEVVLKIEERMRELVEQDIPFEKIKTTTQEAINIFEKDGYIDKIELFKYRENPHVTIYKCADFSSYFYGYMVPSTGYLKTFMLKNCNGGIVIIGPDKDMPENVDKFEYKPKLAEVFKETQEWARIMDVDSVGELNGIIGNKEYPELIRTVEALHEKKIAKIADMIKCSPEKTRLVLISGPSSSGKTSFARRLLTQLRVNNINPVSISLDNYFVDREDTPLDDEGNYDFESINSIDLELFNEHIELLLSGAEVEMPHFNFKTGKREYIGDRFKIETDQPIIVEGIHALNRKLTSAIADTSKFKVYVSALTQLNLDEHNRIPTTDLRLIRRIVRDNHFRGNDALGTLRLWKSVRSGEENNIFPFQEEADIMFNSALVYELAVLKKYAQPLLGQITKEHEVYREAKRLLSFMQYFVPIEDELDIPPTSILREFIGGSRIVGM